MERDKEGVKEKERESDRKRVQVEFFIYKSAAEIFTPERSVERSQI